MGAVYQDQERWREARTSDLLFQAEIHDKVFNIDIQSESNPEYAYARGFRLAAQIIADHACAQRGERYSSLWPWEQDFLFYPVVYLYRHHLELTMKRLRDLCLGLAKKDEPWALRRWAAKVFNRCIRPTLMAWGITAHRLDRWGNKILGMEPKEYGHDLKRLWRRGLRPLVVELQITHYPWIAELAAVDSYIDQFSKIDKNSESFRYATNRNGAVSLSKLGAVSVRHIRDSMERLSGYFEWLDGTLDVLLDHHGETESYSRTDG